jgi:membrane-associated phospholipid phosphatase
MLFKRPLPVRARLFLWGGWGLFAIFVAFLVDGPVTRLFQLQPTDRLHWVAAFLSWIGDWPCILLAGLVGVLLPLLFVRRRAEFSRLLLLVLAAGMLSGFSATIIRSATGRARPDSNLPQGFYGFRSHSRWLVGKYEFGSFPSGHTATVVGLAAAAAWLLQRRLALILAAFALAVAWSRLALGCHYFSDVVAATVWGFFAGPWIVGLLESRLRPRWAAWLIIRVKSRTEGQLARGEIPAN